MAHRKTAKEGLWTLATDTVTTVLNTAGLRSSLTIQQPTSTFATTYAYDAAKRLTNVTSRAGTYSYYYHPGLNSLTTPTRLIHWWKYLF